MSSKFCELTHDELMEVDGGYAVSAPLSYDEATVRMVKERTGSGFGGYAVSAMLDLAFAWATTSSIRR